MSTELTINDVLMQWEYVDRARRMVGHIVTDGEITGRLVLVDGETWSVTRRDGAIVTLSHDKDAYLSHLREEPECQILTDQGTTVRLFSSVRKGVTLIKRTDR